VPPGNSAATQYTEQFPTAGGNAKSNAGINGGGGGSAKPPSKVLGHENAQKLESKGPVGTEVAKLAAESAPVSATPAGGSAHHPAGANAGANDSQRPGGNTGGGEGNAPAGSRPAGGTAPRQLERLLRLRRGARSGDRLERRRTGAVPAADPARHGALLSLLSPARASAGPIGKAHRPR
jgi:hypothetical protein